MNNLLTWILIITVIVGVLLVAWFFVELLIDAVLSRYRRYRARRSS